MGVWLLIAAAGLAATGECEDRTAVIEQVFHEPCRHPPLHFGVPFVVRQTSPESSAYQLLIDRPVHRQESPPTSVTQMENAACSHDEHVRVMSSTAPGSFREISGPRSR